MKDQLFRITSDDVYWRARRENVWKALAKGIVAYPETSDSEEAFDQLIEGYHLATRTGRVIDIGEMSYDAAGSAASNGQFLWAKAGFRWPFHSPFVIVADITFREKAEPTSGVYLCIPVEEDESIIRIAECAITKRKTLVLWHYTEYRVVLHPGDELEFRMVPLVESGVGIELYSSRKMAYSVPINTIMATISICNTRNIPFKQYPKTKAVPVSRYVFMTGPYFSAIHPRSPRNPDPKGHHRSPRPHIRRGHMRRLSDGRQVWVRDMLVNARSEDELSFAERRIAYRSNT